MDYGNEVNQHLGRLSKWIIDESIGDSIFDNFPNDGKKGTIYYSNFFFKNVELNTGDKVFAFFRISTEVKSKKEIKVTQTETIFFKEMSDDVLDILNQYDKIIHLEISENYKELYKIIRQGFRVPVWVFDSFEDGSKPDYYQTELYIPLNVVKNKYMGSLVGDVNFSTEESLEDLKKFTDDCESKKLVWVSMEDEFKNLLNVMKKL